MNSLDTTNIILIVLTAAVVGQFLVVLGVTLWMGRQAVALQRAVTQLDFNRLTRLTDRAEAVIADLHAIAGRVDHVGAALDRTARGAQDILHTVEAEVMRTTRGVHQALDVVSGGYRRLHAVGAGLREGVRELFTSRRQRQERRMDEDAEARFQAGA